MDIEELYVTHAPLVRAVLGRYGVAAVDLDDAVQDVFLTAHRKLPEFEGRSSIATWLHAICWRTAVAARRAHERAGRGTPVSDADSSEADDGDPLRAAQLDHALSWMERLSPQDRDLLSLSELGGLSVTHLAELTGLSRNTVSARLERARGVVRRGMRASSELGWSPRSLPPAPALEAAQARDRERGADIDHVDADCCIRTHGDLVIVMWRGRPDPPALCYAHAAIQSRVERYQAFRYFSVILPGSLAPTRAGREYNGMLMRAFGHRGAGMATATEAPTLRYLVPPVLNGYLLLTRSKLKARFFDDARAAAEWLSRRPGEPISAEAMLDQIDQMRGAWSEAATA